MTHTLRAIDDLRRIPGPHFLAIGVFDGVHLGHQAVIGQALADARREGGRAVVVTFDPHPARLLRPEQAPRLLTSTAHKIRLIAALGVDSMLILPFDQKFAATPPDAFIEALAAAGGPLREICVGFEWSFGKGRAGNLALLAEVGARLGFEERGVAPVQIDGQIVSSTLIRRAVENGDLCAAARMLGREYTVLGTVQEGARIGRTIGFPTANLSAHNEQFPPNGVYAVTAELRGGALRGVANIGVRPTLEQTSGERVFEVHLFDFSDDIVGQDLEVTFRGFLRPERKFPNLEALRSQIAEDASAARTLLENAAVSRE